MSLFPWAKRMREAELRLEEAEVGLAEAIARRPEVEAEAYDLQAHRLMNGWTRTIATIFGGA